MVAAMQARRRSVSTGVLLSALVAALLPAGIARAAAITVTTLAESDEDECTLTSALLSANFNFGPWGTCEVGEDAGTDQITFTPGLTGTIELTGALVISDDVDIVGPGASSLTVARESSAGAFGIFQVNAATTASIEGITISNGLIEWTNAISSGGAGITNGGALTLEGVAVTGNHTVLSHDSQNPATPGGGIFNQPGGTLTIRDSTVSGNSLTVSQTATTGGTSATARGGGIASFGSLTLERTTVSGNTATASVASPDAFMASVWGAGVEVSASPGGADIRLSTISENVGTTIAPVGVTTEVQGGGLRSASLELEISGSTIASNTGTVGANLWADPSWTDAAETVTSTILADPIGGTNCGPTDIDTDGGGNLAHPSACGGLAAVNADPLLGPLAANGGLTMTHAIPATSPAIDAGTSDGSATDQRGLARPVNFAPANAVDGADIGAFELQDDAPPIDPSVSSASHVAGKPSNDPTIDVAWPAATDALSGVDGFSYLWDSSPTTLPDQVKDAEETATGATSPALTDGAHFFHLRTLDNAGNWTSTVHLGPFEIDTLAPETTITKKPKKRIETTKARVKVRFAFEATEAGTFLCKLDAKPEKPCTSPFTAKVKPGKHRFQAVATDLALNADATPARYRFKVLGL